jgi:hypothetical protein
MTINYTTLLGLAKPVTGTEANTWGDVVNDSITSLLDTAIAGTTTITADTTLTTTTGAANQSRQAILLCSPASANITITAPAQSKIYTVINTSATYTVTVRGVGPTTGVTLGVSEKAVVAWNGSDFIKISNTTGDGTFANLTVTGNTTLGDADTDTITQTASYVTGTQLKSAKTATNTLSLAAYDVDGTAYTNLITLTASNTPTLALTSTGVGTINNMSIGATTASTGAFTTLTASTSITNSSLTSGRVTYATTAGLLTDSANLLYSGTDLTVYGLTVGRGAGAVSTNTAVGASALQANTSGAENTAVGYQAGYGNIGATGNTYTGRLAGYTNTAGTDNAGFGNLALYYNTGSSNVAVGRSTMQQNNSGSNNTGLGHNALFNNTTASNNTAVGYQAGYANTTGVSNTAIGYQAGYSVTVNGPITAIGYQAGYTYNAADDWGSVFVGWGAGKLTTGKDNIVVGGNALFTNSSGAFNTAIGAASLYSNTTASNNTAVGYQAGNANTTGTYLTAVGNQAAYSNTTGNANSAFGLSALANNTTGASNTALGMQALNANTTSSNNTSVGYQAGYSQTTGTGNTSFGSTAGFGTLTGSYNSYFGLNSGTQTVATATGDSNSGFGSSSLRGITSGSSNVGVGSNTLFANTTGSFNTAIGALSLNANTTASNNTAVGYQAAYSGTTGVANTAVGNQAAYSNTTGSNNTAIGLSALLNNTTADNNTAVGYQASFYNTTGASNTAIGYRSLFANTTASNNTAVGYQAGNSNTTGTNNCAVGRFALRSCTTGTENTVLGTDAGDAITTGTDNTLVGYGAGYLMTTGSKNSILGTYSGNQGGLDIRTASNYIVLSDGDGNVRQTIDSSGNVGIGTSSPSFASGGGLAIYNSSAPRLKFTNSTTGDASTDGTQLLVSGSDFYIQQREAASVFISTNGTNAVTVDASQNVGIGTSSPSSILNVKAASPVFRLETTGAVASSGTAYNAIRDSTGSDVFISGYAGLANCYQFGTIPAAGFMRFLTGEQVEAMRIDSSGRVFVNQAAGNGNTAQRMGLTYDGNTEWGLSFKNSFSGNVGSAVNFNNFAGTQVGTIQPGASSTAYVTTSDYRLKENVKPIAGALNTVSRLKPCTYDWIETKEADIGFIAHELQEVLPNAVRGEKDAVDVDGNPQYQGIDTSFMVATLTAAIQEQQALITALTARITALEST